MSSADSDQEEKPEAGDVRSRRGTSQSLFDHSYLLDKKVLVAMPSQTTFDVSATYLSLHSDFFRSLFYGDAVARKQERFEIEADPELLEALLDMSYPSAKLTACCSECLAKAPIRMELAVRLDLRCLLPDLEETLLANHALTAEELLRMYSSDHDYNKFVQRAHRVLTTAKFDVTSLSRRHVSSYIRSFMSSDRSAEMNSSPFSYLPSQAIDATLFPDAHSLTVDGMTFLISLSTISFHSRPLYDEIVAHKDSDKCPLLTGCSSPTFTAFIKYAVNSRMLKDLKDLSKECFLPHLVLFLQKIRANLLVEIIAALSRRESMEKLTGGENMLETMVNLYTAPLDRTRMAYLMAFHGRERVMSLIPEDRREACTDIPSIENSLMGIFIKTLTGEVHSIRVASCDSVETLKDIVAGVTSVPPDIQRLIYSGKQLEGLRTLSEYSIQKESTLHLVLRMKGC